MSIKLTTQMDWVKYASYSKYHPDNLQRPDNFKLPDPIKGPPPITQINDLDKKIYGAWGHRLCCERAYGPNETTTRIKADVTPKVGVGDWKKSISVEKGISTCCSAMYGGSQIEPTFAEIVNMRNM